MIEIFRKNQKSKLENIWISVAHILYHTNDKFKERKNDVYYGSNESWHIIFNNIKSR